MTDNTVIEANFRFETSGDPTMTDFLDDVVEHLIDDLDQTGVYVVADTTRDTFTLGMDAGGEDPVLKGLGTIRAAFHACQAETDGWPQGDTVAQCVRIVTENAGLVPA